MWKGRREGGTRMIHRWKACQEEREARDKKARDLSHTKRKTVQKKCRNKSQRPNKKEGRGLVPEGNELLTKVG